MSRKDLRAGHSGRTRSTAGAMSSWLSIHGPEGFGERSSHHADRLAFGPSHRGNGNLRCRALLIPTRHAGLMSGYA
jgi:hypothetical protein